MLTPNSSTPNSQSGGRSLAGDSNCGAVIGGRDRVGNRVRGELYQMDRESSGLTAVWLQRRVEIQRLGAAAADDFETSDGVTGPDADGRCWAPAVGGDIHKSDRRGTSADRRLLSGGERQLCVN
jgi:hypothetical protein